MIARQRRILVVFGAVLLCVVAGFVCAVLFSDPASSAGAEVRLLASRILFAAVVLQALLAAWVFRNETREHLRRFFAAAAHPLNLAIFRVVVFVSLFKLANLEQLVWFSALPPELLVPPAQMGWLLEILPIDETWARTSYVMLGVFSFLAAIGLFTRPSAAFATLAAFYALGVPQFYGKVNHYHHLLWFAALLAAGRSGDAFSVDALLNARKRADQGSTDPPGPSRGYALPLRFAWILIGLIYLFPGLAKWWTSGIDWAWGENLRYTMYSKWAELDGWTPAFRVDRYPLLYRLGALGTMIFEVSFLPAVFFDHVRPYAAVAGVGFHQATRFFMHINFATLVRCYVVFVDWQRHLAALGRRLWGAPLQIFFDVRCRRCRRFVASLRALDVLATLEVGTAGGRSDVLLPRHDVAVAAEGDRRAGFEALRAAASRLPPLWPLLPLLLIPPFSILARALHSRWSAPERHETDGIGAPLRPLASPRVWPVVAVGTVLVVGNALAGFAHVTAGWPLARYPTFHRIQQPEKETIDIVATGRKGEVVAWDPRDLSHKFSSARYWGMIQSTLGARDEPRRTARLQALFRLAAESDPSLRDVRSIRFYRLRFSTLPERWGSPPLQREFLLELEPTSKSPGARRMTD